ncbi:MAG TPA: AI-2E family transporter [Candidatus Saccharimonadales bacterium]|nr:AI-2E family transporter [Candidatus Saccharimonadales bacterium]
MDKQFVISVKTILIAFLMVLGAYIIYRLGGILSILLISVIIVIGMEPLVKFFMKKTLLNKYLSRSFSVILAYILLILALLIMFTIGLPPVIIQVEKLLSNLGVLIQNLSDKYGVNVSVNNLIPQFSQLSGGVLTITYNIVSNITTVLSILILSIYMSLDWENIKEKFVSLFPDNMETTVLEIFNDIEVSVGNWIKGQLFLMLAIGVASFVGLVLIHVNYPLALGIVAGLLEIVPILGPIMSGALAGVIGFSDSPVKGLAVLVLFFIIQQSENNLLVPKVMQRVSGFSPLVILIALLIGSEFFGIVGAILSVPVTMISVIVVKKILLYTSAGSE